MSRNGSRMDDMRNRDRENDRKGPGSIFRPLPDPKTPKKSTKIIKKPVWGPSLGLLVPLEKNYQADKHWISLDVKAARARGAPSEPRLGSRERFYDLELISAQAWRDT